MENLITPQTRLNQLFRAHPDLFETMIAQSPEFQRLRNPVLRRTLAPLTTIEQAARIARLDVAQLVLTLRQAARQADDIVEQAGPSAPTTPLKHSAPAWLNAAVATTLDVRPLQASGGAPLQPIMAAARPVPVGQQWILRSEFEPLPLYAVLKKLGFEHWATKDEEQWTIHFYRASGGSASSGTTATATANDSPGERVPAAKLDVRDLPPPEPMQQILAALGRLDIGQWLYVRHARRPIHLLPLLEQQGHSYSCDERQDGTFDFWVQKGGTE